MILALFIFNISFWLYIDRKEKKRLPQTCKSHEQEAPAVMTLVQETANCSGRVGRRVDRVWWHCLK
jgi:hypothetical protein